ncbi:MAG: amidohydrolase [Acidimicrobiia bacterium]|nr:amidohydrolase [Acidimicrobiia bacterium]
MRAKRSNGPVIDIHCHRECDPVKSMMNAEQERVGRGHALQYGSDLTREVNRKQMEFIRPKMESLETRLEDMDRMGVDIQAVAVSPYQYYYWAEPGIGARAARMINDELAEATSAYPARFAPLATVPLQDTEATIAEMRHAANDLGFGGMEIAAHVEGEEVSSDRLQPVWAEAERLGMLVMIHTAGVRYDRLLEHNFVNILGHAFDSTLAIAHLIWNGVIERHPELKIVVAHGGGYLPAYSARMDHGWGARADVAEGVPNPPTTYLEKFHFDTMVFQPDQLEYLVQRYGADHVMLGTDYPYDMGEDDPLGLIHRAESLTQDQIDLIAGGNAARLLGIR